MTNEELERAVDRLKKYLVERKKSRVHDPVDIHALHIGDEREAVLTVPDLRALLSERAELLATVERMRGLWKAPLKRSITSMAR